MQRRECFHQLRIYSSVYIQIRESASEAFYQSTSSRVRKAGQLTFSTWHRVKSSKILPLRQTHWDSVIKPTQMSPSVWIFMPVLTRRQRRALKGVPWKQAGLSLEVGVGLAGWTRCCFSVYQLIKLTQLTRTNIMLQSFTWEESRSSSVLFNKIFLKPSVQFVIQTQSRLGQEVQVQTNRLWSPLNPRVVFRASFYSTRFYLVQCPLTVSLVSFEGIYHIISICWILDPTGQQFTRPTASWLILKILFGNSNPRVFFVGISLVAQWGTGYFTSTPSPLPRRRIIWSLAADVWCSCYFKPLVLTLIVKINGCLVAQLLSAACHFFQQCKFLSTRDNKLQ